MRAQNSKLEFEEIDVASLRAHVTLCGMKINSWFDIERTAKDSVLNSCGIRIYCVPWPWSIVTISPFLLFFERLAILQHLLKQQDQSEETNDCWRVAVRFYVLRNFFTGKIAQVKFYSIFFYARDHFRSIWLNQLMCLFFPVCICGARSLLITFFRLTKMCNYDHEAQSTKWT